jgi:hypothetical protein
MLGKGKVLTALTLLASGETPLALTRCPKYATSRAAKVHFPKLNVN